MNTYLKYFVIFFFITVGSNIAIQLFTNGDLGDIAEKPARFITVSIIGSLIVAYVLTRIKGKQEAKRRD